MQIPDGYHDLEPGKVASVVTYVEMRQRPAWIDAPFPGELTPLSPFDLPAYRALFRKIGEPWLWFSRLRATDEELRARLGAPGYRLFTFEGGVGLVELASGPGPGVEIALFGLDADARGLGKGRAMMALALREAWSSSATRVWLHTCTLDDPRALGFYRKMGFQPYARGIEIATDPRLAGHLPETAAPQIPLIRKSPKP
ncbi:MAG TPA: GNAT family N-acetyltransferase [Bryobacteraceae bacterium]|nr:GNAT family N-acetyltransferase [Bryobacteraceae bacterium]